MNGNRPERMFNLFVFVCMRLYVFEGIPILYLYRPRLCNFTQLHLFLRSHKI